MYKCLVTFSGSKLAMVVGDVADISDEAIAKDLLKAGYIEEIKPAEKAKTASKKRTTKKVGE